MMGELNIYGVYVPVLLIQAVIAYGALRIVMRYLDRWVEQGWIAMPSIFYLCVFIMLLGLVHWLYVVV